MIILALLIGVLGFQATTARTSIPIVPQRTCRVGCISVTKFSATEWRVVTPVTGATRNYVVEWRLKTLAVLPQSASGPLWSLQGIYGRDLTTGSTDVQLSDATDDSVYEYAVRVCVTGAPESTCDFTGNAHTGETLSSAMTLTLDGVDITAVSVGSVSTGFSLVAVQPKNFLLPKNADGTVNLVTQVGSGTTTHTFDSAGLKVTHTHTFLAGYEGYAFHTSPMPGSAANFNRFSINGGAAYTLVGDDSTQYSGTQITTASMWHTTAHHFKLTMTLPSGGPSVPSDWTYAGPNYGYCIDNPIRPKCYVLYINDAYASKIALSTLGTITQEQQFAAEYF